MTLPNLPILLFFVASLGCGEGEETSPELGGNQSNRQADSGASDSSARQDSGENRTNDAGSLITLGDAGKTGSGGYDWRLPKGFPVPNVPDDNPMSAVKVELGRYLFYDKRLSENETQSCGSCHQQELAFTDGKPVGVGSTGESHIRGSMSLVNVAYAPTLTWANPVTKQLERQALVPLFGEDPVELGLVGREQELIQRIESDTRYSRMFADAFPEDDGEVSLSTITKAIAAFERSIIHADSPYDHYLAGDRKALSASALRGKELFFSETLECFHCHSGFTLSDSVSHDGKPFDEIAFHNTGLYNTNGAGAYPPGNEGLWNFTGKNRDMGRMKTPTLRNVALTAPYMHDGSIPSLEEAIEHYAAGGRTIKEGLYPGSGSHSPNRSEFVVGFKISAEEKRDVIAFLKSLSDEALLSEPRFSDPWPAE